MISQVSGKLLAKDLDRVELMTASGVTYELTIPLGVYESLPRAGEPCALHTYLVVKEDAWQLFGFSSAFERKVFKRVLDAMSDLPATMQDAGRRAATYEHAITDLVEAELLKGCVGETFTGVVL